MKVVVRVIVMPGLMTMGLTVAGAEVVVGQLLIVVVLSWLLGQRYVYAVRHPVPVRTALTPLPLELELVGVAVVELVVERSVGDTTAVDEFVPVKVADTIPVKVDEGAAVAVEALLRTAEMELCTEEILLKTDESDEDTEASDELEFVNETVCRLSKATAEARPAMALIVRK